MSGEPFPKSAQLARGERRYRRKVASPKQWQAIQEAKCRRCRICRDRRYGRRPIDPHHIVARDHHGDDVADNIMGLCRFCHDKVTNRNRDYCMAVMLQLSDAEHAYMIERGGEDYPERAYGVRYER